ncbi:MAG TPA: cytochrome d ubiquinol oxidase subunit II [Syntrophobacter fumaroxidans]|nr:cytochrome d ubiquinol oxidase subunit II [Syntrophobacter fumaroxidans]
MGAIESHLPEIWLTIIGFFLLYYAINDGADLGVGIISLAATDERERGLIMGSIGSIWHDNQTWLVLLGGMLFGAFPLFYGVLLSALYVPILCMLFGLVFRGVSFEFRENSRHPAVWSRCFGVGSLIVTLSQGFALGGLLSGLDVREGVFRGSVLGWANPFSCLVALGVLCGYVMLGSNWLVFKTVGPIQARSYRTSLAASLMTLGISILVHFFTAAKYPQMVRKLTTLPEAYSVAVFPVLAAFCFVMLFVSLRRKRELAPLLWNAGIILFSFIGLSLGMYPDMIPNVVSSAVTVHAAAASKDTLEFMLQVTSVLLPVILVYTGYKHRIFQGKVITEAYTGKDE